MDLSWNGMMLMYFKFRSPHYASPEVVTVCWIDMIISIYLFIRRMSNIVIGKTLQWDDCWYLELWCYFVCFAHCKFYYFIIISVVGYEHCFYSHCRVSCLLMMMISESYWARSRGKDSIIILIMLCIYGVFFSGVFSMPAFLPATAQDLIHRMLTVDPAKRITITQVHN